MEISLTLNGTETTLTVEPFDTLLAALRRHGLISVRYGSDTGETGASAVLIDGRLVNTDCMLAAQVAGHRVMTLEALNGVDMHPLQAAFAATGAMQSGYSTPATVLGAYALLQNDPNPSEADIRDMLSGILDRETAYVKPVEAILRAAAVMRGERVEPFGPLVVAPMTDGSHAVVVDPQDPRLMASAAIPRLVPSDDVPEMAVVGKPEIKVDAIRLVKGNPAFTDDFDARGQLEAKVLRSPHAHARILDIDDSKALALPGVHAVLHYKNTPRVKYASGGQSWPNPHPYDQVSFDDKVRHVGDR
ncbi:MAG: xanthine dehydrogenase, molybdenum binding subunit apoprotein, partial [Acidimicrobiaceae bacterium]